MEKVSIIITTYKGSKKIGRAISSICYQTYKNIQLIVVDDNGAGTDEQIRTSEVVTSFKDKITIDYIVHDINRNGSVARNSGINVATGEYLAFLDDDDFYFPSKIEKCVNFLNSNCEFDAVYTSVAFLNNNKVVGIFHPKYSGDIKKEALIDQSFLGTGSNIFIRNFKNIYFDESFLRFQDIEFMIRFLSNHKIGILDEVLCIKDITESRFFPDYNKLLLCQNQFYSVFANEIDSLSYQEKIAFYKYKQSELIFAAYKTKNSENIHDSYSIYENKVDKITIFDKFKFRLKYYYMSRNNIFLKLIKFLKKQHKDEIKQCNKDLKGITDSFAI